MATRGLSWAHIQPVLFGEGRMYSSRFWSLVLVSGRRFGVPRNGVQLGRLMLAVGRPSANTDPPSMVFTAHTAAERPERWPTFSRRCGGMVSASRARTARCPKGCTAAPSWSCTDGQHRHTVVVVPEGAQALLAVLQVRNRPGGVPATS